tara:strand:- start:175 stop:372 length:198 start_codon:yes stop_codon:yes gene_type:complete
MRENRAEASSDAKGCAKKRARRTAVSFPTRVAIHRWHVAVIFTIGVVLSIVLSVFSSFILSIVIA